MEKSSLPPDAKLIRLIWSFKQKRNPLGELTKHKARLCVHGGMQRQGIDYWHTYAPVVKWNSMRAYLTLSVTCNWRTRAIDFDQAHT